MTDAQEFCLRWNNHQSNLISAFYDLKLGEDFVDVTLACDGRSLQAHKVVLSACSPFFRDLLKTTPCKHPVIVLKDISFRDLLALVEFMYQGEVRVRNDGLSSFLRAAEVLRVRGLTEEASRQKASQQAFDPSTINSQTHNLINRTSPAYSPQLCQYGSHHIQSDTAHSPVTNAGVNVSTLGSHWTGSLDEVKEEDVDLDSSSNGGDGDTESERTRNAAPHHPSREHQHHRQQQLLQQQQHLDQQKRQELQDEVHNNEMEASPSAEEDKERLKPPDDIDEVDDGSLGPASASASASVSGLSIPAPVAAPCLTLQSFARIPSLVAQDFNPPVPPPDFLNSDHSGPPGIEDRRLAQEIQVSVEQDNLVGRTPGRTSTSDRPRWPCPFCLRLLSSRSSVRRHIEDRHTNDNSRHPCPLCERLYRTRNSLQYHLSTAHRDREPGPRGRPRTRPRTPPATNLVQGTMAVAANDNKNNHAETEASSRIGGNLAIVNLGLFNLATRGPPPFGQPPP